jgi:outer membrane receptor protein involved in Fe transport
MSELKFGAMALAIGAVLCQSHVYAQVALPSPSSTQASVSVSGVLRDSSGKLVPATAIKLQPVGGGAVYTAVSDDSGRFVFDGIAPGSYTVAVDSLVVTLPARTLVVPSAGLRDVVLAAAADVNFGRIQVVGRRLDKARQNLSPDIGADIYRFGRQDMVALPEGQSTPLNEVLLQAPGVAQDSFGQLHIRGDHANVQYRINGITLPESIAGFGQTLGVRAADQIDLITGALPAQFGYRTAGIVDITTRGGAFDQGGKIGYIGGSHQHNEGFGEAGGSTGDFTYFITGTLLADNLGIESPTADRNPLHDHTQQENGFGYFSYHLSNDSRLSVMLGIADNKFQIPDIPGQAPLYQLAGIDGLPSASLDANQREKTQFATLALQGSIGPKSDYQIALIHRYSSVRYEPDPVGDLIYTGVGAAIFHQNDLYGLQGDLTYTLDTAHTVRTGVYASRERVATDNTSEVFPADEDGNQTSTIPFTIEDDTRKTGKIFGVYVQDEWKLTDRLTMNYGARFDWANAFVEEHQLSPRLGIVYKASKDTTLHAGYARYFTPPPTEKILDTSVEKFIGTTNALPSDANTSVTSERSNYYDAGMTHQITSALSGGVDLYYRDVKDLQDEGQFGNALLFSPFNYARGKIYGIELSSSYREGNFAGYVNFAYASAKGKDIISGQFNFDPDELVYIANHWVHLDHDQTYSASFGASYLLAGTTLSASGVYGSGLRRGFANTEHVPGYVQADLGALRSFDLPVIGKLEGRFTIVNVFDKSYELRDGTGIGVGAPQFGPRRAFYVSIAKPFTW